LKLLLYLSDETLSVICIVLVWFDLQASKRKTARISWSCVSRHVDERGL